MKRKELFEQHEEHVAELIGGKMTKGSGCGMWDKGDVVNGTSEDSRRLMVECKCTQSKDYRLTLDTWKKACKQAALKSATPVMAVRFCDHHGCLRRDFYIVPDNWSSWMDSDTRSLKQNSILLKPIDGIGTRQAWIGETGKGKLRYELAIMSQEKFEEWLNA
jgi:hypothetical protein